MNCFWLLIISPSYDLDACWEVLAEKGVLVLYGTEEPGAFELVVECALTSNQLLNFPFVEKCSLFTLPEIDWATDWKVHSPQFVEGKMQLDLCSFGGQCTLSFIPGAGFGNCSHPTTRLMLKLMSGRVASADVLDIGSGSGILTLAALALGAQSAVGIDIDREANAHAEENARINQLQQARFLLPIQLASIKDFDPTLVLMNMILKEQQEAWSACAQQVTSGGLLITSGILAEQREAYIEVVNGWRYVVQHSLEEDGWLAFILARCY